MSRTDISQNYSQKGIRTRVQQTRNFPWQPWTSPVTLVTTNCPYDTGFRTRAGNATSGYQSACDSGNLPENYFNYSESFDSHCQGRDRSESATYPKTRVDTYGIFEDITCNMAPYQTIASLLQSNLDNKVRQKLLERVKDSDVNLGVIWGEREQTFRLLADALKKLGKAYNQARSGNFSGAGRTLTGSTGRASSTIARNWLELQYGWLPLMSDIYGLCATVHKASRHREYVVVRYRSKIQDSFSDVFSAADSLHYRTSESFYESSARVKMRSSSMFLSTASELGLTNPLAVAWELVPFSFVVDWALPIGSFLNQIDASVGWTFVTASLTKYSKDSAKTIKVSKNLPAVFAYRECNVVREMHRMSVVRAGIVSWSQLLSLPYIKNPISLTHAANALALLTSKR